VRVALPILAATLLALPTRAAGDDPPVTQTVTVERTVQGKGVDWWARRALSNRRTMDKRGRTIRRLRRTLAYRPDVQEALALASVVYRVPLSLLRRRAWCESRWNPRASNGEAFGLMQFLPSTWRSQPFAGFSIWSPYASAFAGAWMQKVGRGGEWACR
jgi:Transglycosylase SLT domain